MGTSQEVFVYYGWMVKSAPYKKWAENLDYELPEGFMLVGMDSKELILGVRLFRSGSSRWDPMVGYEEWSTLNASVKLNKWLQTMDPEVKRRLSNEFISDPKFIAFVQNQ